MECLTSKYAAMKLLSFYIHIKNIASMILRNGSAFLAAQSIMILFDRLYDLIDEAAGHGFLVRGTSFDHCSGNTLKDRIGLRSMLDAVENGRIEAVLVRDLEQISRNSYILVGVIEILRQNDVYLITTECDLNAELINSGLERFVGDRFTRASFGKPRFDVRLPLMDQF